MTHPVAQKRAPPPFPSTLGITERVRTQYEAFPYPRFPLFLALRPQEAYASHSLFAARLAALRGFTPAVHREAAPRIFLAGCGDTYPSLAARWEPRHHCLIAWDLSARNLRRARLRCLPLLRSIDWTQGNLEDTDTPLPENLSHVDAYGVLHHLADPAAALRRLGAALLPGGTLRLMAYNPRSRRWIRHWQRIFSLLGLTPHRADHRRTARRLLETTAALSPALGALLNQLAPGTMTQDSRFVDTFFHAREARLGWSDWMRALDSAGLIPLGLLDRAGELDDLPNPLRVFPDADAMETRIADARFENHFEIYAVRPGAPSKRGGLHGQAFRMAWTSLAAGGPPRPWFSFPETRKLPLGDRHRVWRSFLRGILRGDNRPTDIPKIPIEAIRRLARLGALFSPGFGPKTEAGPFGSEDAMPSVHDWDAPLAEAMEPPDFPEPVALADSRRLRAEVQAAAELGRLSREQAPDRAMRRAHREEKILATALRHIHASQRF